MFNTRQLLALELTGRLIQKEEDIRIKNALATNLSDLLSVSKYVVPLRFDGIKVTRYIFSVHEFPGWSNSM